MTPGFLTSIVVLLTTVVGAVSLVYKHFVGWTPRARERNALKKDLKKARKTYVEARKKHEAAHFGGKYSDDQLVLLRNKRLCASREVGRICARLGERVTDWLR